jgi:hypothetical protein
LELTKKKVNLTAPAPEGRAWEDKEADMLLREVSLLLPVSKWTPKDVGRWIETIGLDNAKCETFTDVDGKKLLALKTVDLTGSGRGHELTEEEADIFLGEVSLLFPVSTWSVDAVGQWLKRIGLGEKRPIFKAAGVDGPLLLALDIVDLTAVAEGAPAEPAPAEPAPAEPAPAEPAPATALNLSQLEAKKLLHRLESLRPFPEEKRKVIREMIVHENTLFDQRRSHFAVLQGLLFTAASILVQSNVYLVYVLAVAGCFASVAAGVTMRLSFVAMRELMKKVYTVENSPKEGRAPRDDVGLPVIGLDLALFGSNYVCSDDETVGKKLHLFFSSPCFMPALFAVCWIVFAIVLRFTMGDPNGD